MLQLVAEHNISVKTNSVNGLEEIPKLLEMVHSGRMQGKGIVVVDREQIERERGKGASV